MTVTTAPSSTTPPAIICRHATAKAYAITVETPRYPVYAYASGPAVTINVVVSLDATGKPISAEVQKSSGNAVLDSAAMKAALASTFAPKLEPGRRQSGGTVAKATPLPDGVLCGVPVPSHYLFTVTFDPNR